MSHNRQLERSGARERRSADTGLWRLHVLEESPSKPRQLHLLEADGTPSLSSELPFVLGPRGMHHFLTADPNQGHRVVCGSLSLSLSYLLSLFLSLSLSGCTVILVRAVH